MDDLKLYIDYIAWTIEIIGITTIIIGIGFSLFRFIFMLQNTASRSYKVLRQDLGKGILLGLEILVAGDIIATVAAKPQMNNVLVLAVIVLIRTFLSLSIEVEIEGKFPWQSNTVEE